MSFWDSFTGKSQRKDIQRASADAERLLAENKAKAEAIRQQGLATSRDALTGGYAQGRTDLNSGYDAAGRSLNAGYDTARGDINAGYAGAENAATSYLDKTGQVLQPLIQSGQRAQARYDTALGLDGKAAADSFYQDYAANDPFRAYRDEMANNQLLSLYNAKGQASGGRAQSAVARESLRRGSEDLQTYLTRLANAGQQGGQYAGQLAGYTNATGNTITQLRANQGQNLSQLEQNRGQGIATMDANRGTGLSNLATNQGRDIAQLETGAASDLSGLQYGYGQQLATNRINTGNAVSQTRGIGLNNLMKVAGLALSAGTGIPLGGFGGGGSSTSPGTSMNGGWTTTTSKSNPLFNLWG
jgi:hypothetical protein